MGLRRVRLMHPLSREVLTMRLPLAAS